jgi:hypothetical protein
MGPGEAPRFELALGEPELGLPVGEPRVNDTDADGLFSVGEPGAEEAERRRRKRFFHEPAAPEVRTKNSWRCCEGRGSVAWGAGAGGGRVPPGKGASGEEGSGGAAKER